MDSHTDPFAFEVSPPDSTLPPSRCRCEAVGTSTPYVKPESDWSDEQLRHNLVQRGFSRDQQERYLKKWYEVKNSKGAKQ